MRVAFSTRAAVLTIAALTLLGVLDAIRMLVTYAALGHAIPWTDALGSGLADWLLWAPLVPVMATLAARFPFSREHFMRAVAVHSIGAVVGSCAQLAAFAAWSAFIRTVRFGSDPFVEELRSGFTIKFSGGVLVWLAFVIGRQAFVAARRATTLQTSLTDARLAALEARLQPHFLFNTLNTIAHLIRHDPDRAERAVIDLGELLRVALGTDGAHEVPIEDEFALLHRYLRIQHARFGDRLEVTTDVDPAAARALLPPLLLQPLVENAIHHGIGARPRGGSLRVSAERKGDRLVLRVLDDGDANGDDARSGSGRGFGLRSARERLDLLYGDAQSLRTARHAGGGTEVVVELPLAIAGAAP